MDGLAKDIGARIVRNVVMLSLGEKIRHLAYQLPAIRKKLVREYHVKLQDTKIKDWMFA